jgi:hypothetical protein
MGKAFLRGAVDGVGEHITVDRPCLARTTRNFGAGVAARRPWWG